MIGQPGDRLGPIDLPAVIDEGDCIRDWSANSTWAKYMLSFQRILLAQTSREPRAPVSSCARASPWLGRLGPGRAPLAEPKCAASRPSSRSSAQSSRSPQTGIVLALMVRHHPHGTFADRKGRRVGHALLWLPSSQGQEPPGDPGRFRCARALDLALLINGEHHRMAGRVHGQAHDVLDLRGEGRVV